MALLQVQVLTPEGPVYDGEVASVVAPAIDGSLGILPRHAPLITALGEGQLKLKDKSGAVTLWRVEGGFLEVLNNHISVLAEKAEATD